MTQKSFNDLKVGEYLPILTYGDGYGFSQVCEINRTKETIQLVGSEPKHYSLIKRYICPSEHKYGTMGLCGPYEIIEKLECKNS